MSHLSTTILAGPATEDYLTSFSGIEPGDLDPEVSKKALVRRFKPFTANYGLLLNMGCTFVGHGLQDDFRCINLVVPKDSVIRPTLLSSRV